MKFILLVIVTAVAIVMSPKASQRNGSTLDRIQTDARQTFPHSEQIARAWFVEMVAPVTGS